MKILEIKESVPRITNLPDGMYKGSWCGSNITIVCNGKTYDCETMEGIRGISPVVVTIKGESMTFEELSN